MEIKQINEFPHVKYDEKGIGTIDFRIEKLPISKDQKIKLVKSFGTGKGIIGKMPKSNKLLRFMPSRIAIIKNVPKNDKELLLPSDWHKYAVILKDDNTRRRKMKQNELREMIKKMINEEKFVTEYKEDKSWLFKEIRKLEDAYKVLNSSPLLAMRLGSSEYGNMVKKLWNVIKVGINSAKLDYESEFGKAKWKIDPKGFPK